MFACLESKQAAAQSHAVQANNCIIAEQKDNEYDRRRHAQKAGEFLVQECYGTVQP